MVNLFNALNISTNAVVSSLGSVNIDSNRLYHKYSYNTSIFKQIDTEEKAYWLGFLYADGYVSDKGVELALKESDYNHLIKFDRFIIPMFIF